MPEQQDETLQVPQGMSQEEIIELWQGFSQKSPESQEELSQKTNLFKTFNQIKRMGADVQLVSDVEVPGEAGGGASLALRVVGALGQGLGALSATPVGIGAGTVFSTGMNALANIVDAESGQPTEAVPFSGLASSVLGVENPFTTGNPVADAGAEGLIDAMSGLGLVSKVSGIAKSRMLGKDIMAEYVAKRLDKSFVEDLTELESKFGQKIPLTLKERGVGGSFVNTLSSVVSARPEDAQLVKDVSKGLVNTWKNA